MYGKLLKLGTKIDEKIHTNSVCNIILKPTIINIKTGKFEIISNYFSGNKICS
jgi:hypothetical protein